MNIYITVGQRPNRPFLLSLEDRDDLQDGLTEFQTAYSSPFVTGHSLTCSKSVYDAIAENIGTLESPALIGNVNAPIFQNRQNVYIENGALKLLA
jgi:hypothetical protein